MYVYHSFLPSAYIAAYMSPIRDKKRFTISEASADWQELMVTQRIMWQSVVIFMPVHNKKLLVYLHVGTVGM